MRGESREREREQREREEKDYNTHLADISSGSARAVQSIRSLSSFLAKIHEWRNKPLTGERRAEREQRERGEGL